MKDHYPPSVKPIRSTQIRILAAVAAASALCPLAGAHPDEEPSDAKPPASSSIPELSALRKAATTRLKGSQLKKPIGFQPESEVLKAVESAAVRRQEIEKIFNGRTFDGNLQLSVHQDRWTVKHEGEDLSTDSGKRACANKFSPAGPRSVAVQPNEVGPRLIEGMGMRFAMSTVSDEVDSSKNPPSRAGLPELDTGRGRIEANANLTLIRGSLQIDPVFHSKDRFGVLIYAQTAHQPRGRPH